MIKSSKIWALSLLAGTLFLPQITFAAWWNPTSWGIFSFLFSSGPKVEITATTTTVSNIPDTVSTTDTTMTDVSTSTITTSTQTKNEVAKKSIPKAFKPVINVQAPKQDQVTGTLCNGTYYSECPVEQKLICPQSGNAYCQISVQQSQPMTVATTSTTTPTIVPVVDKGTPYKGQDGNWYYPNAYDANVRNLQVIMPTPRLVVTATPADVKYRGTSTINWTASDATSCTLNSSPVLLSPIGSQTTGSLGVTTSYTLTCTGKNWTESKTATVNVQPPVLPPPGSMCAGPMLVGWQIDACAKEYPDTKDI